TPLTLDAFNLLDFFDLLKKHRIHLILKPHPRVPMKAPGLPEWVTLCSSDSDIYPFFPLVDILLTDYSSIHTEFLLLDRPVIFFWADFQSYNVVDRGLQFPVEDMSPGPKCFDGPSLFRAIVDAARGKDEWGPARRALRDKAFSHQDGKACERIAARLLQGEFAPETGKPPAPPAGTPSEHA
ncbi:MAG: CDP-glycerol glycerophosphotransferase family protein, partial [Desulfovibrionaceae bacterium]